MSIMLAVAVARAGPVRKPLPASPDVGGWTGCSVVGSAGRGAGSVTVG